MKPVLSRSLVNFRVIRDALVIHLLAGPGSGGPEEAQKLQIVNAGGEPPHIPVQVGADVAGIENVGIGILPADQCRHPAGKDPLKDGRGIQHCPAVLPLCQGGQLHPEGRCTVVPHDLPIG